MIRHPSRAAARRRPRRLRLVVGAALAAATLVAAGQASAHTTLKSTSPARNATASTTLAAVLVTFNDPIRRGTLRVTGPKGVVASVGTGGRDPRNITRLTVRLKSGLAAGRYTARWSITAVDGHAQSGTFGFRLVKR